MPLTPSLKFVKWTAHASAHVKTCLFWTNGPVLQRSRHRSGGSWIKFPVFSQTATFAFDFPSTSRRDKVQPSRTQGRSHCRRHTQGRSHCRRQTQGRSHCRRHTQGRSRCRRHTQGRSHCRRHTQGRSHCRRHTQGCSHCRRHTAGLLTLQASHCRAAHTVGITLQGCSHCRHHTAGLLTLQASHPGPLTLQASRCRRHTGSTTPEALPWLRHTGGVAFVM